LAEEADLDLVEVAPMARPPVAKLMDYGKFKYESAVKAREARKNQAQTVIKEMKLRPKIDVHDYETKKGHVVRFLREGDKVKITIMFRGREQSRPEMGARLLQRLAEDVVELGFVESAPKLDGRNMIMVLGPHKKKADFKAERNAGRAHDDGAHHDGAQRDLAQTLLDEHAPPAVETVVPEPVARQPVAPQPAVAQLSELSELPELVAPEEPAPAPKAPAVKAAAAPKAPKPATPATPAVPRASTPKAPTPKAPTPKAPPKPRAPAAKKAAQTADEADTPA
jgi:translation initiation factor IF-3